MNGLPLHPSVVHLPIALAVLVPIVSLGLVVAWMRGWLPRRAWLLAAALQLMLVVGALAAMRTGEADEERVEAVLASERGLEAHEEAAEVFVWAASGALLLFVAGAAIRRESAARVVALTAVASSLVVLGLGYRVGHAGGTLVYTDGAARAYVRPAASARAPASGDHTAPIIPRDHHDDDHDDD